jgi:hypothetical protein
LLLIKKGQKRPFLKTVQKKKKALKKLSQTRKILKSTLQNEYLSYKAVKHLVFY